MEPKMTKYYKQYLNRLSEAEQPGKTSAEIFRPYSDGEPLGEVEAKALGQWYYRDYMLTQAARNANMAA